MVLQSNNITNLYYLLTKYNSFIFKLLIINIGEIQIKIYFFNQNTKQLDNQIDFLIKTKNIL